jgi:hypothetical protein
VVSNTSIKTSIGSNRNKIYDYVLIPGNYAKYLKFDLGPEG